MKGIIKAVYYFREFEKKNKAYLLLEASLWKKIIGQE